jgi:hypothetical protein
MLDTATAALLTRVGKRLNGRNYDQSSFCGTACCIAGHLVDLTRPDALKDVRAVLNPRSRAASVEVVQLMAVGLLTLRGANPAAIQSLFSGAPSADWPEPFATEWATTLKITRTLPRREAQAAVARRRIEYFIRNDR